MYMVVQKIPCLGKLTRSLNALNVKENEQILVSIKCHQ